MSAARQPAPRTYHSLSPFREEFASGVPVLTYHKLGPRPRGVRRKGLYVDAARFRLQLEELAAAGFRSPGLSALTLGEANPDRQIVLTFDDGFESVHRWALAPLEQHGFRAVLFLVADRLGASNDWEVGEGEVPERLMDRGEILEWLASGHEIGSHTLSHPSLTAVSTEEARGQIRDSKARLEDAFGRAVRHFCYPYGHWNHRIREIVAEASYQTACTTQVGVNTAGDSLLALRRFAVRHPTRTLRSVWAWLQRRAG